jgi:hypothetical protein
VWFIFFSVLDLSSYNLKCVYSHSKSVMDGYGNFLSSFLFGCRLLKKQSRMDVANEALVQESEVLEQRCG